MHFFSLSQTQELVSQFSSDSFPNILAVLETCDALFMRYRHEFQSETLWKEIFYVKAIVIPPLLALWKRAQSAVRGLLSATGSTASEIATLVKIIKLCGSVIWSLNSQDVLAEVQTTMVEFAQLWIETLQMSSTFAAVSNRWRLVSQPQAPNPAQLVEDEPAVLEEAQVVSFNSSPSPLSLSLPPSHSDPVSSTILGDLRGACTLC